MVVGRSFRNQPERNKVMSENKLSKKALELSAIAKQSGMTVEHKEGLVLMRTVIDVERTGRSWGVVLTAKGVKKGWVLGVQVKALDAEGEAAATYDVDLSVDGALAHRTRRMNLNKAQKANLAELVSTIQALKS